MIKRSKVDTINELNDQVALLINAFPPPTMACMRQIAHELLETLKVKENGIISIEYEPILTNRQSS